MENLNYFLKKNILTPDFWTVVYTVYKQRDNWHLKE